MTHTIETITVTGKASYVDGKLSNFLVDSIEDVKVDDGKQFVVGSEVIYSKPIQGYFFTNVWKIKAPELVGKKGRVSDISRDGFVTIEYEDCNKECFVADRVAKATPENIEAAQKLLQKAKKNTQRINAVTKRRTQKPEIKRAK